MISVRETGSVDICFVDESGNAETLCTSAPASSPVYAIAGLFVPEGHLKALTWDFLAIKKRFNPHLEKVPQLSTVIEYENKGSDLRADVRSESRRRRRRAFAVLDAVLELVERHQCRIAGRVFVKDQDAQLDDIAMYTSTAGFLCQTFHRYLDERGTNGLVILDARTHWKNTPVTGSIATQKFRHGGDPFPRLAEVPVFGHSTSHVALQVADLLVSGIIFPMACSAFCGHHDWNHHSAANYDLIRSRYAQRMQALQYRFYDASVGFKKGGIHVRGDGVSQTELFRAADLTPEMFSPSGDARAELVNPGAVER